MKNQNKKKLHLANETIKTLTAAKLARVAGAGTIFWPCVSPETVSGNTNACGSHDVCLA